MCAELSMPLHGQPRAVMDRDELISKWEELSNYTIGEWVHGYEIMVDDIWSLDNEGNRILNFSRMQNKKNIYFVEVYSET